jgi:hypothetical protein
MVHYAVTRYSPDTAFGGTRLEGCKETVVSLGTEDECEKECRRLRKNCDDLRKRLEQDDSLRCITTVSEASSVYQVREVEVTIIK